MDLLINVLYTDNLSIAITLVAVFVVCEVTFILLASKKEKYKKLLPIPFVISFISIILAMPFLFNEVAMYRGYMEQNWENAISTEKKAIELSFMPIQKGINYIRLSQYYKAGRNGTEAIRALEKAQEYFKGYYDHHIWKETYYDWFIYGQFDNVINLLKDSNIYSITLPETYLILGKEEETLKYLMDETLHGSEELAIMAYILKNKDNEEKSLEYYNKALELTRNDKQKAAVEGYYNDAVNYIITKLNKQRTRLNLPPLTERVAE